MPSYWFQHQRRMFNKESTGRSSRKRTKTLQLYWDYFHRVGKLSASVLNHFSEKQKQNKTKQMSKKNWTLYETFESTDEIKLMMKYYLCFHNFSVKYLALCALWHKEILEYKILTIILVQGFPTLYWNCSILIEFHLKFFIRIDYNKT